MTTTSRPFARLNSLIAVPLWAASAPLASSRTKPADTIAAIAITTLKSLPAVGAFSNKSQHFAAKIPVRAKAMREAASTPAAPKRLADHQARSLIIGVIVPLLAFGLLPHEVQGTLLLLLLDRRAVLLLERSLVGGTPISGRRVGEIASLRLVARPDLVSGL